MTIALGYHAAAQTQLKPLALPHGLLFSTIRFEPFEDPQFDFGRDQVPLAVI